MKRGIFWTEMLMNVLIEGKKKISDNRIGILKSEFQKILDI